MISNIRRIMRRLNVVYDYGMELQKKLTISRR